DRAKYDLAGISKFGLVEMTRERIHNTVQTLSFQTCPYCQGKGRIKSALTMSIYALRELKKLLKNKPARQVNISLNPVVIDEILKNKSGLESLERQFKTKINLISDPAFHAEDIKIA
ncbi:MAG: hypothetical protein NT033_02440, partial [Candidatus Omnitrophica bacterium]|nr:hypothetical protein [Candidatus Omnitrophota bacterium]